MSCERYKSWIEDAAVEALDPRHQSELNAHLDHCSGCRALLERERALTAAIDSTVIASVNGEPSPYFATRVRARIAEGPQRAAGFVQWLPLAAGALAIVAAVGFWMPRSGPPTDPKIADGSPVVPARVQIERSTASSGVPGTLRSSSQASRTPAGPQVLVAPGEKAGFRSLYEFARAQRLAADALPNVAESRKPLETPELKIKPMEIAALDLQPPAPAAPAAPVDQPRR